MELKLQPYLLQKKLQAYLNITYKVIAYCSISYRITAIKLSFTRYQPTITYLLDK
jgi:hypothetical protein